MKCLTKMQILTYIDVIDNFFGIPILYSVLDSREIGSKISVSTITFCEDTAGNFGMFIKYDSYRTIVIFGGDIFVYEFLDDIAHSVGEVRIFSEFWESNSFIKTFPNMIGWLYMETVKLHLHG